MAIRLSQLQLHVGLTGPAFFAGLPPTSALRRMQGPVVETFEFEALTDLVAKVWCGKSQASPGELHFFADPIQWWDNRRSKPASRHPDLEHKMSKVALSLAMWDAQMKVPSESVSTLVQSQGALEVQMCSELCDEEQITDAVAGLNSLVQRGCHVPNNIFYRVLKRCIADKDLVMGRRIHALTVECGYEGDAFLATHLIGLYASHGRLEEATRVFSKVSTPSAHNWSTIIFAHARHGEAARAIRLYQQMRDSTAKPGNRIYVAVLKACATAGDLVAGKEVHSHILASPEKPNIYVETGLVDMYAKCGSLEDALRVFIALPKKDVGTWNAMIAGYVQQGMGEEALSLYRSMQQEHRISPNSVTFVCLLQACAIVGRLPLGNELHAQIEERGMLADVVVGGALVHMYAKCGSMFDAQQVFESLPERTMEAWGALIGGYTRQGDSEAVFTSLERMRLEGTQPSGITFLSVLTVCSHVGLVDKGRKYFEIMMTDYGISPTVEHYSCMMDLLGRAGLLDEALQMAKTMPHPPTAAVWRSLLGACQTEQHRNWATGF